MRSSLNRNSGTVSGSSINHKGVIFYAIEPSLDQLGYNLMSQRWTYLQEITASFLPAERTSLLEVAKVLINQKGVIDGRWLFSNFHRNFHPHTAGAPFTASLYLYKTWTSSSTRMSGNGRTVLQYDYTANIYG
jgi:hypothetical protein